MVTNLKIFFSISFLFFYSYGYSQTIDSIFENQLYVKLNSLDNISESSWKLVESSPNNINSTAFPFGALLDSIGLINIKQPFGIKKKAATQKFSRPPRCFDKISFP